MEWRKEARKWESAEYYNVRRVGKNDCEEQDSEEMDVNWS